MTRTVSSWVAGYRDGQSDLLAWLTGSVPASDEPMATIVRNSESAASLWALGHNLAIAGGLHEAARRAHRRALIRAARKPDDRSGRKGA